MRISEKCSYILDVTRASAAQMVVISHTVSFLGLADSPFARIGVVVFFILSGFLIAYSVQQALVTGTNWKDWVIKRFSRIYSGLVPALFFILVIDYTYLLVYGAHPYPTNFNVITFLQNLASLQNHPATHGSIEAFFFSSSQFGTGRPLWTVSVEWWLYISFGMLCFLGRRMLNSLPLLGVFVFCSYVPFINLMGSYAGGLTLIWGLGCLGFWSLSRVRWNEIGLAPVIIFGVLSSVAAVYQLQSTVGHYATPNVNPYDMKFMLYLSSAVLSVIIGTQVFGKPTFTKAHFRQPVKFLARYSYTLYLIHYTILIFLSSVLKNTSVWFVLIAVFVISNLCAVALASVTEFKHRELSQWLIWLTSPKSRASAQ